MVSACARRSAKGASPSYTKLATNENSSDAEKGEGASVSTVRTRTRRFSISVKHRDQARQVEYVAQAFAVGLEHDRK